MILPKIIKTDSGYTLLELLITITFVSIAFLAIMQLFVGSLTASADIEGTQVAMKLGESKIEQLMSHDLSTLSSEVKAVVSGFNNYTQMVTITATSTYEKEISVTTFWKVKGSELGYNLRTIVTNP